MAYPSPTRKSDRVCILGFAPHYNQAPFIDPTVEMWGLNQLGLFIPRADRWFELHPWQVVLSEDAAEAAVAPHGVSKYMSWLKSCCMPVFMIEERSEIPTSLAYPLDAMVKEFFPFAKQLSNGKWIDAYFRCSASFMLAMAISEGYKEIFMYGVDMAQIQEYREQRPSCEYLLGVAYGRGIKIHLPNESNLLRSKFIYGYDDESAKGFKADCLKRKEFMTSQMNTKMTERANADKVIEQYNGALQDLDYMMLTHSE